MTATYTNNPAGRPIDTVRYEIDDKDCIPETDAVLSDEEIQYLIDSNNHVLFAAADAAEAIGAKYASDPSSKDVGDFKLSYPGDGRSGTYAGLAKRLRARAAKKAGSSLYAGGISKTDKAAMETDSNRVQPVFKIGMDDNETSSTPAVMDY
jgi:hypothetical protein